ncbi:MAG: right-handed parallel beta-helix repeat-containing protein, partial [Acidobacteria bacterium]|nr:right-handed parallel beta-helix repeat-containing protein [Acidobacteriota bacterium]
MLFHSHVGRLVLGFLLAGLGTLTLAAQTIIGAGAVSGTWTLSGSPYLVQGDITIESSQLLTVEPGVEVRFAAGAGLVVTEYGRLFAEGTPEALIVFTSQAVSPVPGDWTGLKFARTGNRVTVRYCRIEYAATAILCTSWDCKCEADDNFSVIENCQILSNSQDGIFCLAEGCSGWICVPTDPLGECSPTIAGNWICANGGYGIRMDIHHGDTRPQITRNVIDDNGLGGIRCEGGGPTVHNNDILHHAGPGITGYLGNDRLRIVNNIIAWNNTGVESLLEYLPAVMQYNVLWQNNPDYVGMSPTDLDLVEDPLLMNHLVQNYALQIDSPCIDAGDPRLARDPDLTRVDIGAYFLHQSDSMPPAAAFMADEAAGVFPLTTGLVDLSSGKVSAWNWDFGDGTTPPSSDTHYPIHTYEWPGNYTVTLTVSGPDGEDTLQREDYLQVLPRSPSATDIVYPQIALGGGYTCIFMAGNRTDREWRGRIELRQGFEAAWSVPWCLDGEPQAGFSADVILAPGATRKFIMTSDEPLQAGYLRVMSEQLPARDTLATALFYNYRPAGDLVDSTATPQSQPGSRFWFLAEKSEIVNTGLAYCSADRRRDFDVTLTLYDAEGNLFDQVVMNYDGHTARFFAGADGIFPAVPEGFLGAVCIESANDICLAVLSMTATGENAFQLTSLPPALLPATGQGAIVYPHVALGGGYECTFLAGNHTDAVWSGNVELLQGLDDPWPTAWSLDGVPQ